VQQVQQGAARAQVGPTQAGRKVQQTRRGFLAAAGTVGGAVALAACGQTGGSPTQTKAEGSALFWQWGAGYVDGFQALVNEFNEKKTGVTINFDPGVVSAGSTNYWDKLTAAMAGSVGPDVFLMNTNARTWATQGQMRALDDLIKKDKTSQDLNGATLKAFKDWYDLNGKQMGWAWDYSTIVTIVNVGHLREAGLKPPSELGDKWDWNTYREYAQKMNKPGQRFGGFAEAGYETGWLNFVRANGGDFFSEDRKRCILGDAKCIEAVEYLANLVIKDKYAPTRAEVTAATSKVDMFVNGQVSMTTNGDWNMTDVTKKASGNLQWDVAPIPFKNGKTGNSANLRGMVINAQTKNPDQAFEWMKFALSKPVQDRIPKLFGEVPARLDSANEIYASSEKAGPPAGRASLKPAIAATKALPALDKIAPADFHNIATPLINDAWDAKISVREALTKAQTEINALIQQRGT
jgi:multiple sugar transport system substrate-binding protein